MLTFSSITSNFETSRMDAWNTRLQVNERMAALRLKKVIGNPLTVGLLLGALNFLAIVLIKPKNYAMGIATLAIFGGVIFVVQHAWMSLFVDTVVEKASVVITLRQTLDFIIIGAIILLMIFGGHPDMLSGPTARFRFVTPLMSIAVWVGYLTIWLYTRTRDRGK
ncbi:hypothetical protein HOI83_03705 [Candidatus Uhrbacteria bacterium]|nr:hypothetical protein [Candidatus Uhrbacteria bacterium]